MCHQYLSWVREKEGRGLRTFAPRFANARATPAPIPRAPPVTIATFPAKSGDDMMRCIPIPVVYICVRLKKLWRTCHVYSIIFRSASTASPQLILYQHKPLAGLLSKWGFLGEGSNLSSGPGRRLGSTTPDCQTRGYGYCTPHAPASRHLKLRPQLQVALQVFFKPG